MDSDYLSFDPEDSPLEPQLPEYLFSDGNRVGWYTDRPPDFVGWSVDWNYHRERKVVVEVGASAEMFDRPAFEFTGRKWPSMIMKSALQKAVRLGLCDVGYRIAEQMITSSRTSLLDFLRRMSIITVEDGAVTGDYTWLVWYLAVVSKQYPIGRCDIDRLLEISRGIFNFGRKDQVYKQMKLKRGNDLSRLITNLDGPGTDVLWSMLFRKSYGAYTGDLVMIDKMIARWVERIRADSPLARLLDQSMRLPRRKSTDLSLTELPPTAIDHHCSSIAETVAADLHLDPELIREQIWERRSRTNILPDLDPTVAEPEADSTFDELWEIAAPLIEMRAAEILSDATPSAAAEGEKDYSP